MVVCAEDKAFRGDKRQTACVYTAPMKTATLLLALSLPVAALAQTPAPKPAPPPPATLRSSLLSALHSTHDKAEWFVPINTAVAGMTAEQAKWVPLNAKGSLDPDANHSVGMLAYHLWFWNSRALAQLEGKTNPPAPSNNDETFNDFNPATWAQIVRDNDAVMTGFETLVANADDATLAKIAPTIEHICTHNAYHVGQILYVRKLQGSWNPANGVK